MVTDWKDVCDHVVTNASAGPGADDRRSGIEAPSVQQSMASSKTARAGCTQPPCQQMTSPKG
eukprot:8803177-Pyramimonas_sp.AAC.1